MPDTDAELLALARAIAEPDHPIKRDTATWAAQNLAGRDMVAADHESVFAIDDWRRCAEYGITALMVPEEHGGAGADLATTLLTLEGLGYGCVDNGLTFALASQMMSTQVALVRFGTDAQRERWLPGLLDGSLFAALAMTELDSGSDAYSMAATAVALDDGSYRLNGHKAYLTFGPVADLCVVFASTRPEAGSWGVSTFLVPMDLPGIERQDNREKMGMRTTPFGDITFDDVIVPADALLGREGAGARIFGAILDIERSYVFAPQVGAMERQLDEAVAYARTREQGGHPIGHYQAVSHRIVDMKERHERARLFLYRAAIAEATGSGVTMAASLAKIVASDAGIGSALDAAKVHGAKGYVTEFEIERQLRDAVGGQVYSGTSDVLRNIVARLLRLG
ncbi:MAG: acyl-CoA dehydrogenase family protein [Actinomycetota bacterium]